MTSRLNKEGELTPGDPAVIKLDDSCSIINKTLKSAVSEWIIYQIGARLIRNIHRNYSHFNHSRDDEFIIFLKLTGTQSAIISLIEKIVSQLIKPHIFSGYHITVA